MNLSDYIEHTLLKPDITLKQIQEHCLEALKFKFIGICVNSYWIPACKEIISQASTSTLGSAAMTTRLVSVIGFPLGASASMAKAYEAEWAVKNGASEIDMVLNIGALKGQQFNEALQDIKIVKAAVGTTPLKVIIETGLLNSSEKEQATQVVLDSGADFIKTCTGFSSGQATVEDILLMRSLIKNEPLKIKASGGIRSYQQAQQLIEAGASRLGTSQGAGLISGQDLDLKSY